MDKASYLNFILLAVVFVLLNIPFGGLRAKTRKFSLAWFLCIHTPIPIVAVLRRLAGYGWSYIPIFLIFCIAGQFIGSYLADKIQNKK